MCYASGMEVIYLDQLFAVNFLVDYCIVLAAARMADVPLRRWRYAAAALAGAVYAALSVLPGLAWLAAAPVKAASGVLIALAAFGGEARFWRCTVLFFGTSALFAGAVLALSMAAGTDAPGWVLQRVTARILIPAFAVCYAVVTAVFRRQLRSASRALLDVAVTVGGQTLSLRAMQDSGNALCDPVTGKHAAVAHAQALRPLLGDLSEDPLTAVAQLRAAAPGARLVPYSAVGVSSGLLPAFSPDTLTVGGRNLPLLIALSPTPVSADGSCQMLLPADN